MRLRVLLSVGLGFLALQLISSSRAKEPRDADEFFEKDVRPILVEKCQKCHGDAKPKGHLKLTARGDAIAGGDNGPAIVAGKPDESLLIKAVRYHDDLRMPPTGKLSVRQIENLEKWVKLGAPWPGSKSAPGTIEKQFTVTDRQRRFWSFQPISGAAPPKVRDAKGEVRNEVDRFLLAKLEAQGLSFASPADKRTLLRRTTFDLIGLPPTSEEIEAFLADETPQAFAKVVDRLLESPRYGERWGRHWLDVVRYADARDLIQLPRESDFREAWRFRDWVVESFNRDLPYRDFVRMQVAGDLLESARPGGVNRDGLVATGLLAIADFVPGDVDKNQMIADYVNDQVDVVGRAFLGLSIACARCHDHKFDPISTEDYYGLAGIFFSTRIIPSPVKGNTPLVRAPLLSPEAIAHGKERDKLDARRRMELEETVPEALDHAYREFLVETIASHAAEYLMAACEYRGGAKPSDVAKRDRLSEPLLKEWIVLLNTIAKQPEGYPQSLRDLAAGRNSAEDMTKTAAAFQKSISETAKDHDRGKDSLEAAARIHLRADDPKLTTSASGQVIRWPNRAARSDAMPSVAKEAPVKATANFEEHERPVIRFDGKSLLELPGSVPPGGTLYIVYQHAKTAVIGERIVGWEDSNTGQHGLGLMRDTAFRPHAILRNNGASGDLLSAKESKGFQILGISWGPGGTSFRRNGVEDGFSKAINAISSDPKITALRIGGPGSGDSPRFNGDIAELRVYNRKLSDGECKQVETELQETWFQAGKGKPLRRDLLPNLFAEWISPRGPFWPADEERLLRLSTDARKTIAAQRAELEALRKKPRFEVPEAVVAQDGGPKETRHEGFKDSPVFIRGDHKRPGKVVPRGFPTILSPEPRIQITSGSGRLQLADWLTQPENPLTARVMVNRIWQHHFGEGLVRTPNDFGERGERPTHPELLDFLAGRFVESGWSVKAMHRLIMNSAAYGQSSRASEGAMSRDPDNKLFARMNRRRLDAEAIRDSLLAVSGKLDGTFGGPPFTELGTPRRTLYLMSARTGANTSDFGRLFDRADPSLIVGQRGQSIVAPQALFFRNDPFVSGVARSLASRIAGGSSERRIKELYILTLGRSPTKAEIELGLQQLRIPSPDAFERYCLLVLCTNEFIYVD
jgi:hypothetical protein